MTLETTAAIGDDRAVPRPAEFGGRSTPPDRHAPPAIGSSHDLAGLVREAECVT